MTLLKLLVPVALGGALSACSTSPVLVFGQSHSVGITMGGGASDAQAELTVGYKDRDIAVVPVAIVSKDGAVNKDTIAVRSTVGSAGQGGSQDTDALSVLGQFQVNAKSQTPDVGLGKFFATGLAAQKLADGFACKLSAMDKCPAVGQPEPPTEIAPPATPTAAR